MANFNRKVKRQKKFTFTEKEQEKAIPLWQQLLRYAWIPRETKSFVLLLIDFLFSTIFAIPLLMLQYDRNVALLLGHGVVTAILIVLSFYRKERMYHKATILELGLRYSSVAIPLLLFSGIVIWVL